MDGLAVELLERGKLGIWFSRASKSAVTAERLREHEIVVRTALRSSTPIPLRYGASFPNVGELASLLNGKQEDFGALLEQIGDRVEMGARVSCVGKGKSALIPPPVTGSTSGRSYLEARRKALAQAAAGRERMESLLDELAAELAGIDAESTRSVDLEHGISGSLAHLLHRQAVPLYRTTVQGVQERRPDLRISVSGPWAPYSFV